MDPPPTHFLHPAQNYVYSHPPPSAADPALDYVYPHPPQNHVYPHPPPSSAQIYYPPPPPSSATPAPVFCTPMSPYKSQSFTPYSLPHPQLPSTAIHAANSAFYHPHSSNLGFRQNASYPVPQSLPILNTNPPIPQPNHNDDYLRRIRNEVIFLHALWDQGPPASDSNFNFIADPVRNLHLKPSPTTAFKKKNKTIPVSDNPWPVPPKPSVLPESGWHESSPRPTPPAPVSTEEDMARVSASKVQRKALDSFRSFFGRKDGLVSGSESDDDEDEEDDDDNEGQEEEYAKFDRFGEVFEGDPELRDYYVKNWGNGDFLCLICGGSDQKVGRKYKNAVALVQHTVTVSNTKKKKAHRAYGQVICKVLGWDINQLPLVSRNLSLLQGNGMSSAEACKDDHVVVETSIAPLLSGNKQSDPSKTASSLGEDISSEKKETSDLSIILDNPGGQQISMASNSGTRKNHPDISEQNAVVILNEHVLSDPATGGTETADGNTAEKNGTPSLLCTVMDSQIQT